MSDFCPMAGQAWRMVEGQHRVSTLKLVDTLEEQALLEDLLDDTKPPVPQECRHLHYLLFTPFRYDRSEDSRFARANTKDWAFYAAEHIETAVAEIAFHRLRFFGASPLTPLPKNPLAFSAFAVAYETAKGCDLTNDAAYSDPHDYTACLGAADKARALGGEVIRSTSARDPQRRANITLLTCAAFAQPVPLDAHIWHLKLSPDAVLAQGERLGQRISFKGADFV